MEIELLLTYVLPKFSAIGGSGDVDDGMYAEGLRRSIAELLRGGTVA